MAKASEETGKGSVLMKLREERMGWLTTAAAQKPELPLMQRGLERVAFVLDTWLHQLRESTGCRTAHPWLKQKSANVFLHYQTSMRSVYMRNLFEMVPDYSLLRLLMIVFLVPHLSWLQTTYYFPAAEDAHHHHGKRIIDTYDEKHICIESAVYCNCYSLPSVVFICIVIYLHWCIVLLNQNPT